mmetsp:Transcript_14799/g.32785  ORF Transcript_14799/g.32785 Transcript_14799/m.32785 type:complete len:202 (+) Transcript_14799:101-706(+)
MFESIFSTRNPLSLNFESLKDPKKFICFIGHLMTKVHLPLREELLAPTRPSPLTYEVREQHHHFQSPWKLVAPPPQGPTHLAESTEALENLKGDAPLLYLLLFFVLRSAREVKKQIQLPLHLILIYLGYLKRAALELPPLPPLQSTLQTTWLNHISCLEAPAFPQVLEVNLPTRTARRQGSLTKRGELRTPKIRWPQYTRK